MDHSYPEPQGLTHTAAFHTLFNHPVVENPAIPSPERCKLRIALLQEELNELAEAIQDNNLVEVADALADLQYVLSGAVHEFGLGTKFSELFNEVQRSNMSKACTTREEAEATQTWYKENRNFDSAIEEKDGVFLVFRTPDHKVLKSVNYSPADISQYIK